MDCELDTIVDDLSDISTHIFHLRGDFMDAFPVEIQEAKGVTGAAGAIYKSLSEALMLCDDAVAIMVDELGADLEQE